MKILKTASGKQTIKLSKKEWTDIGKKAGWMKVAMNMEKMDIETEKLNSINPTKFVDAYCSFWATAFYTFQKHLPKKHINGKKISIEAVDAFKRCFGEGYSPKLEIYE
jgi:hypothetical protein